MHEIEKEKTVNTEEKVIPAHLFQKGDDPRRNIEGRPKGSRNFTTLVRELLLKNAKDKHGNDTGRTQEELMGQAIIRKAISGDTYAARLVWSYLDGMPQQKVDHTTDGEKIFQVINYEPKRD